MSKVSTGQSVSRVEVPAPIDAGTRLESVDIIRGIALFAIYLVNLQGAFGPARTAMDRGVTWFYAFFIGGSFYPVFCFLFGLGFAIQLERISSRGVPVVPLYIRRLVVLYLMGTAHVILLSYQGDVMREYAVMAVFLLLLRNRTPRAIVGYALVCLAVTIGLEGAAPTRTADVRAAQSNAPTIEGLRAAIENRDYLTVVRIRAAREARRPAILPTNWDSEFTHVLSIFLIGLYAGKRRLLHNVGIHRRLLSRVAVWTLTLGVLLKFVWFAWYEGFQDAIGLPAWTNVPLFSLIGGPMLSFFYISSLTLWLSQTGKHNLLRPFAWAGRMPVTIYMAETAVHFLIITMILGVPRTTMVRLGPSGGLLLKVLVFAGLTVLSRSWLGRFRFGPVEWVWRSLTYGRMQPLRIRQRAPAPAAPPSGA